MKPKVASPGKTAKSFEKTQRQKDSVKGFSSSFKSRKCEGSHCTMVTVLPNHSAFSVEMKYLDIMVIDDSEAMLRLYRTILSSFGIKSPRLYQSASDALEELHQQPADLILVDWRMGPPNGIEFVWRLRSAELYPVCLTSVIMVTGHASASFVKLAMRVGAQQFLVKPVSPRTLFERIDWVTSDDRELVKAGDQFVVDGIEDRLRWYERSIAGFAAREEGAKTIIL